MANISIITFDDCNIEKTIIGPLNIHLTIIEEELNVNISHINNSIVVDQNTDNNKIKLLRKVFDLLYRLTTENIKWQERDLIHIVKLVVNSTSDKDIDSIIDFYQNKQVILNTYEGKKICVKTLKQKLYIDMLKKSSIVFAVGAAGTGKTYLAVAYAVSQLKKGNIKKIIITRPVVEAGEKLGFLPGDLKEKVDPYLIPIYDALEEFLGKESLGKLIEKGNVEIAPLAYMRGRTLDNAIIILDEAQNTTKSQMKMFLTRLGFNSKMIVTGDITQIDLPSRQGSGLIEATNILKGIKGIDMVHFIQDDVMRHPLVSKIIERYEENNND